MAVPACVHAGTIGVAPSWELLERARAREAAIGTANPPSAELAWPPAAADGLRTYPPRENGGNMDIRDLGPGARLWMPVHVPGALLSVGDLHFAQGDGEVCISAIETGGSATFRVGLRRDGWRPTFPCYEAPPRLPRAVFATTGIPLVRLRRAGRPRPEPRHPPRAARAARVAHDRARARPRGRLRPDERGGGAAHLGAGGRSQRAGLRRPAAGRASMPSPRSAATPRCART